MGNRSEDNRVIGVILKMSSLALFLSFLLATVVAIPAPRNRVGDCAAADDYIDEVLVNVAKMVVEQGYDPAELPGDGSTSPRTLDLSLSMVVQGTIRATLTASPPSTALGKHSSVLATTSLCTQT